MAISLATQRVVKHLSRRRGRHLAVAFATAALAGSALAAPATADDMPWLVDDDHAQCPNAQFETIQKAVDQAEKRNNDKNVNNDVAVINVCPGLYEEQVSMHTPVTIVGQPGAIDALDCFQPAGDLDSAVHAVLQPPPGVGTATGIDVLVGSVGVVGLVIDGWDTGVQTVDEASGYRIEHNVIQRNRIGVDIRSSGPLASHVDYNCARGNPDETTHPNLSAAIASEPELENGTPVGQTLRNAGISHNRTFQNRETIVFVGSGFRKDVVIQHNVMVETAQPPAGGWGPTALFPIATGINNSEDVSILDNQITGARFGVFALANNEGLEIGRNTIQNGRQGLFGAVNAGSFGISFRTGAAGVPPTTHAHVFGNVITTTSIGIHAQPNALLSSTIENNISNRNASPIPSAIGDGIRLMAGDTGNTVSSNTTDENSAFGIYAQLAVGNVIAGNTMHANGAFDARDDSVGVLNTWVDNSCVTDSPDGLCTAP